MSQSFPVGPCYVGCKAKCYVSLLVLRRVCFAANSQLNFHHKHSEQPSAKPFPRKATTTTTTDDEDSLWYSHRKSGTRKHDPTPPKTIRRRISGVAPTVDHHTPAHTHMDSQRNSVTFLFLRKKRITTNKTVSDIEDNQHKT